MSRSDRILLIAVVLSLALHLAALFGTPRLDLGRIEEEAAPAPLQATIVARPEPPAAAVPAQPVRRPAPKSGSRPKPLAPAAPSPSTSVLDAPLSPDGEPVPAAPALAESGPPPEGAADVAGAPAAAPESAATEPGPAGYPLRRARLVYDLFYLTSVDAPEPTKIGQITHRWSQDGRKYEVESVAEAVGFVSLFFHGKFVQRATGEVRADGLQPAQYTLDRGRGKTEVARFDWSERKLALAWKDQSQILALPAAARDPLSMMHQLYFSRRVPDSGPVAVVTSRKLYSSSFALVAAETLVVPAGAVRTLHYRRTEPNEKVIELWADLDRGLLPARVRVVDKKGNVLDQVIREVELELAAPTAN